MESQAPTLFHVIVGTLALVSAVAVVLSKNPVISAMSLMATLFATGTLYFGMGFYFIGAAQILIYAGAISVLFVFIVMLLDLKPLRLKIPGRFWGNLIGAGAGLLLLASMVLTLIRPTAQDSASSEAVRENAIRSLEAKSIALQFLSKFMLPFQMTAILILAAIMGVVILGRPKNTTRTEDR